ncbi:phage minor head protein [Novosphingobium sp.]|uniref:phage minor head protein n=1 Tax=Novosphingobium sp. TaxID=1874826 RepID=UPI00286E7BF5|nr:phage minor head protein [Novosphingobium sp.]
MRYDLKAMVRRKGNTRRKSITFRTITPPAIYASDLFAQAYAPILKLWEQAATDLIAQYERSLREMTTDSPSQVSVILSAVENEAGRLMITLRIRLEAWAARIERWQRGRWAGAVKTATGLDISDLIGPRDMREPIAMVVERNVGLIKSVSDQARQRIGEAVFAGLNKRAAARDVAADIRAAVAMGRRRSLGIASDQLTKMNSSLAAERRREAGLDTWEWVHSGKLHPREEHRARNGKRYSDDPADNAPPPEDRPGELPFCGCTERAVLDLESEF